MKEGGTTVCTPQVKGTTLDTDARRKHLRCFKKAQKHRDKMLLVETFD